MCTQATGSQTLYINTLLLFLIVLVIRPGAGSLVNHTIDDQYGDSQTGAQPAYTPSTSFTQGSSCSGCGAKLNSSEAFDETWHDGTIDSIHSNTSAELRISMQFTGVALYTFCIMPNTYNYSTFANYTFSIDGDFVGSYQHKPDGSQNISYQVPVYTNTSLANEAHEFIIHIPRGSTPTLVLFDYVIYTTLEDSANYTTASLASTSPTSSPTADIATLAGGIGGGLAFLVLIICVIIILYRGRWKNKAHFGHRLSFKESPPSPLRMHPIVQLSVTTPSQSHTSVSTSEVSMNRPNFEQPPDYQHTMGRLLHLDYMQTALPLANDFSPLDQVHQRSIGLLQQPWQQPPLAHAGFTNLRWHTEGRNCIPTIENQLEPEVRTSFHRASNADEAQKNRSRHTLRTMTDRCFICKTMPLP